MDIVLDLLTETALNSGKINVLINKNISNN